MKYLKEYKIFESGVITDELVIDDIKNCFLSVSDMIDGNSTYGVRISEFSKKRGKVIRDLNINGVDFEVMVIPEIKSHDKRFDMSRVYRPTSMSNDMISEIKNSSSLVEGLVGLKLEFAAVEWVNAYNYDENGPGTENKRFSIDGIIPKGDKVEKGNYKIDYLYDFLKAKDDKVRWVKLFYKK